MRIGVFCLQGAFIEHIRMLERLGAETFEIRQKSDLDRTFDGLVIPGGESTVIGKLLGDLGITEDGRGMNKSGTPVCRCFAGP